MAIVIPDQSGRILLNLLLDDPDTWIHLYVVDTPLTQSTTAADLTEASWPDYLPMPVRTWTDALTQGLRAVSFADPVIWTRGPGGGRFDVYGYWISGGRTGLMYWVERRPQGPIRMLVADDVCAVYPRLTLRADPDAG